jgi:hypothetical protein
LGDTLGNKASGTIPVGGIIMWSGTEIPTGWQLCNNSLITSGSLAGQFTPNLVDKFIVCSGGAYQTDDSGGSADAVVVSHSHTGTTSDPGGHIHSINHQTKRVEDTGTAYVSDLTFRNGDGDGGSTNVTTTWAGDNPSNGPIINAAGDHTHTVTINPYGESGTNKNLPPYYALAFIMRVS